MATQPSASALITTLGRAALEAEKPVIKVTVGHQYGQEVIRPACEAAHLFCEMVNTRTLTSRLIGQIKRLGYRVVVIQNQPTEL